MLAEAGLRFVRATAKGTGSQMGREVEWDLATHSVLAWRWRPLAFPAGADERDPARNDSALAVYAVFGTLPIQIVLRAVKYVWSRSVPAGTTLPANRVGGVVRSGPPPGAAWIAESVDLRRDFERLFGEPPPRVRGLAVLTDADASHGLPRPVYGARRAASPK